MTNSSFLLPWWKQVSKWRNNIPWAPSRGSATVKSVISCNDLSREASAAWCVWECVCVCVCVCVCESHHRHCAEFCLLVLNARAVTPQGPHHPLVQSLKLESRWLQLPMHCLYRKSSGLDCWLPFSIVGSLSLSGVKIHRRHRDMYPQSSLNIKDISVKGALHHYYKTVYFSN